MAKTVDTVDYCGVACAFWLNQSLPDETGKTKTNWSGLCRDSGLNREQAKKAVGWLQEHDWEFLEEAREALLREGLADKVKETITRARALLGAQVEAVLRQNRAVIPALNKICNDAALSPPENVADEEGMKKFLATNRIQQFALDKAIGRQSRLVGSLERLEAALQPKQNVAPVFNNQNIQLTPDEKRSRFLRLEALQPLPEKNANNGS